MPTRKMTKREKEYAMENYGMLPNEMLVLEQDEVAVKQLWLCCHWLALFPRL